MNEKTINGMESTYPITISCYILSILFHLKFNEPTSFEIQLTIKSENFPLLWRDGFFLFMKRHVDNSN